MQSKGVHGCTIRANSGQVYEGELINIDVTSAGATVALGLTYFATHSKTVSDWLKLPQSQYLLESVRPDLLQLRVYVTSIQPFSCHCYTAMAIIINRGINDWKLTSCATLRLMFLIVDNYDFVTLHLH